MIRSEAIIKAISGAKFNLSDLYNNEEYKELEYNSISLQDSEIDAKIISIGEMINQEDLN